MKDGLVAGLFLAATEAAAVVLTGRNLSLTYIGLLVVFDFVLALMASGLARAIRGATRLRGAGYADRLLPLIGGLLCLFAADKVVMSAVFGGRGVLAPAALVSTLIFAVLLLTHRFTRRTARTRDVESSCLVSIGLIVPFLVDVRWHTRSLDRVGRDVLGLTHVAVLAALLVAGVVGQDRWFARTTRFSARRLIWLPVVVLMSALVLSRTRVVTDSPPARPAPATHESRPPMPSVVLISVDTLRADHLSVYGYERDTTPNLTRFGAESVVFTHALSPATWTIPGHVAMLSGRFPGPLGTLAWNASVPSETVLLAERLRAVGYRTGAVVANSTLLDHRFGWSRGFEYYSDAPRRELGYTPLLQTAVQWLPRESARATAPWRTAAEINRLALAWVSTAVAPYFLFVNYGDTHLPYMPPDPWPDRYPGRVRILWNPVPAVMAGERDLSRRESDHFRALYDGSVSYVDEQIGALLNALEAAGGHELMVIVTSDHGEFLGEHRLFHHAVGPYEPVHRVPLLVRFPGRARRGVEPGWVQLVDIVPTVLQAVGLPPAEPLDGEVLPRVSHPIMIDQAPLSGLRWRGRDVGRGYTGVYEGPWKLVAFDEGSSLLFDLASDPQETIDRSADEGAPLSTLGARLEEARRLFPRREPSPLLNPDLMERLRAGGYLR